MYCNNCGKNLNESDFTNYSLVTDNINVFESITGEELSKAGKYLERHLSSCDESFGDVLLKEENTRKDRTVHFFIGPEEMKRLIDRANKSIKNCLRVIRSIDKILNSSSN